MTFFNDADSAVESIGRVADSLRRISNELVDGAAIAIGFSDRQSRGLLLESDIIVMQSRLREEIERAVSYLEQAKSELLAAY